MVSVNSFSKIVHFAAMWTASTASQTAKLNVHTIITARGMQPSIVSDRDALFTSDFWSEATASLGTSRAMSAAYHPPDGSQ